MSQTTILIAGGYGVVGRQIAAILKKRQPDLQVLLAGRNPKSGRKIAEQLGCETVKLDLADPDPLAEFAGTVSYVIACVNDINDHLMRSAIRHEIALIDLTRWTTRLRGSMALAENIDPVNSPVVFASSWMASTISTLVQSMAVPFQNIDNIDIHILYAGADQSGPNSVEYMDRLATPFETMVDGAITKVRPFRKGLDTNFPGVGTYKCYLFDAPDHYTLPLTTGAKRVATRIGFDDQFSGPMLSFLVRTGIWTLLSAKWATPVRKALLYNPGEGASHHVRIALRGRDSAGVRMEQHWLVSDPLGQTHLTAIGAVIQLERLILAQANRQTCQGVQLAEDVTDPVLCQAILEEENVSVVELDR